MTLVEMQAWSSAGPIALSHSQAAEMASVGLVEVVAQGAGDTWLLHADSSIGVALGDGWELRVRPRLAVPNLFFLLAYAADPKGWKERLAEFQVHKDLLDAIASGFSWHALKAIDRGLLRGYVHLDERLTTIRGRVRFGDQIARNTGLPLPVEVSYDDYTADILENQMLLTATVALLRLPRAPVLARKRLLKLRGLLNGVSLVERPAEVRMPPLTRLNQRYGTSLRLAELILRCSSIDPTKGPLGAVAFVFDMNKVFEDFVTIALREAMGRYGGTVTAQWAGYLDKERQVRIRPDVSWWDDRRCLAVIDAKYKALSTKTMPNADLYQMLAYCTALGLSEGFLVYAKDGGEQQTSHTIINHGCLIAVRTLDVEAEPGALLQKVQDLAGEIAARSLRSSVA